jgi:hypothetical protein
LHPEFTERFVLADVTHPLIGADFLSYYGLLVDCRINPLLDAVTSLYATALAVSSLVPSMKIISGGSATESLLSEFSGLICPTAIRHITVHHIRTTPGPSVTCLPRRLAHDRLAITKAEFGSMLRDGTARHFESSWSFALHIVLKKDNGWPLCGDYRPFNAGTIPDRYPVRYIHYYSHQLFGRSVFSIIYEVRAYNRIPVNLGDIHKIRSSLPLSLALRVPFITFGLLIAAGIFQRFMDDTLRGHVFCFAYLDDILVFSRSLEETEQNQRALVNQFQRYGVLIN